MESQQFDVVFLRSLSRTVALILLGFDVRTRSDAGTVLRADELWAWHPVKLVVVDVVLQQGPKLH
jgi:hypothetical protein